MTPIRANEPILVDYVFNHLGYNSDHARIFAIGGLPDELLEAHEVLLDIQKTVMATARPGVTAGAVYDTAVQAAADGGLADYFMGADPMRIRFVGHGVGLELDEYPFLAAGQELELAENMIIALEPKAIFPGKGVVGIENTHLVTETGLRSLTLADEAIRIISPGY